MSTSGPTNSSDALATNKPQMPSFRSHVKQRLLIGLPLLAISILSIASINQTTTLNTGQTTATPNHSATSLTRSSSADSSRSATPPMNFSEHMDESNQTTTTSTPDDSTASTTRDQAPTAVTPTPGCTACGGSHYRQPMRVCPHHCTN